MGIWAIWSPLKIHCYTCMSFKTCWSRLIYTKLSSHRSFVINMYVITMAWRCISPWSFHRSLQRRREMDIFNLLGPCVIRPFIYHPQWPAWSLWRNWKFRAVLNCPFTAIMASNETFDLTRNGKVFKLRIATGDMTVSRLSRAWAVHYALLERELPQQNMLTKIKFLMQFRTH